MAKNNTMMQIVLPSWKDLRQSGRDRECISEVYRRKD